ncbi:hypothetical protein STEG23_034755 [Scotinomys teguina]
MREKVKETETPRAASQAAASKPDGKKQKKYDIQNEIKVKGPEANVHEEKQTKNENGILTNVDFIYMNCLCLMLQKQERFIFILRRDIIHSNSFLITNPIHISFKFGLMYYDRKITVDAITINKELMGLSTYLEILTSDTNIYTYVEFSIFFVIPHVQNNGNSGTLGSLTDAKENTHMFWWEYVTTSFLTLFPPSSTSWFSNEFGKKIKHEFGKKK